MWRARPRRPESGYTYASMSPTAPTPTESLAVPVSEVDHARGELNAPITLVQYGDYECPDCAAAFPVVARLREALGARLRFVFRNFPQNSIHPHASVAAQAAEAAGAQGKFWPMHDLLYAHQATLADHSMDEFALKLGLEIYKFNADLSSERFARRVREDFEGGQRSGVKGTPTFFINGQRYRGEVSYEPMIAAIEAALRSARSA
jgi:protein-disulfide isomerase